MGDLSLADILQALPGLIWAGIAVFVVARFHRPFRDEVLPRLSGIKVMGLQIDLRSDEAQRAVQAVPRDGVLYPPDAGAVIVARAERSVAVLRGASVLWVDDNPMNNTTERRLLSRLHVFVETARSTEEAVATFDLARRSSTSFELVISDLARPGDPAAGRAGIERLRAAGFSGPVIYYIGHADPLRPNPADAFGLTDRPDELLHLVMDALERRLPVVSPTT